MIVFIGNLIVKAALLVGVLILTAGAGIVTYGGANVVRDIIQPNPTPTVKSEFIEPSPSFTPTPVSKPAVKSGKPTKSVPPTPIVTPTPLVITPTPLIVTPTLQQETQQKVSVYLPDSGLTYKCHPGVADAAENASRELAKATEHIPTCVENVEQQRQNCVKICQIDHEQDLTFCDYALDQVACINRARDRAHLCLEDCHNKSRASEETCYESVNSLRNSLQELLNEHCILWYRE